nr:hypothetical protein [uncultured Bdellovibrio sp.]
MDISEFLKPHPGVTVATEKDNQEILNFFSQTQIQGRGLNIAYDRAPDFFAFLKIHSPRVLVLIYRGVAGDIQGVATMLFRKGYVDGKVSEVCYLGDLRMGFDRKGAVLWRKIYGEFFARKNEIDQLKNVELFYTCLIDDNELSQRSLARNKKSGFAYHRVCPYSMVTLMMKKPGLPASPTEYEVTEDPSLETLIDFYKKNEDSTTAGYLYSQEILERLKKWPQLSKKDFLIVRHEGRVVAACALWSPRECKRILLTRVPFHLRAVFSFLRVLSFGKFQFAGELKVLYVTHLLFDQKLSQDEKVKIFKEVLKEAWKVREKKGYHFLSFCDFKETSLKAAADSFITNDVAMAIHEVMGSEDETPASKKDYGFEMALV